MKRTLVNRQSTTRKLLQLFLLCAVLLAPKGAWADSYNLWIGNTQVTDDNKDDVLGNNSGVSFANVGETAPAYVLTLNSATVTGPIKIGLDLTIDVKGTCSVTVPSGSVIMKDPNSQLQDINLTLKTSTADGYLTLTSTSSETIENGGVFSYGLNKSIDNSLGLLQPTNTYNLTDGSENYHTVRFVPSLGVSVGDGYGGAIPVYDGNAGDVFEDDMANGGRVSFDKTTNTLTLNGAKLGGPIQTSLQNLKIELIGNNSISLYYDGAAFQSLNGATPEITIGLASNSHGTLTAKINSSSTGFADGNVQLNIGESLAIISGDQSATYNATMVIAEPVDYDLWVMGIRVTNSNNTNIPVESLPVGGKFSFDTNTNTLTLENVNYQSDTQAYAAPIINGLSTLNINLKGTNSISCGQVFLAKSEAVQTNCQAIFTTDIHEPGNLTIHATSNDPSAAWFTGHGDALSYANGLKLTDEQPEQDSRELTIAPDSIGMKIGNTLVTNLNKDDVLGDGSVSFDPSTNTLTLNGASITAPTDGYPIESNFDNLTIHLVGNNTLIPDNNSPLGIYYSNGNPQPTGGTITFTREEYPSENGFGRLTVDGTLLCSEYYQITNTNTTDTEVSGWRIEGTTVAYIDYYDLWAGAPGATNPTRFSSDNLEAGQSRLLIYVPKTNTLRLLSSSKNDLVITSQMPVLNVTVKGETGLTGFTYDGQGAAGTIAFSKDPESNDGSNSLSLSGSISGFSSVTINEPLKLVTPTTTPETWNDVVGIEMSDIVKYNLWISGKQVTTASEYFGNNGNEISFDGEHTLTLNKCENELGFNDPVITNGLPELTINLIGQNEIYCAMPFLAAHEGDNFDHHVTFKTNTITSGSLTIGIEVSNNNSPEWCTAHTISYQNLSAISDDGIENQSSWHMYSITPEEEVNYELTISDIPVTSMNADNVLGDWTVSYDASSNTLELNGATINGDIVSGRASLIVSLEGVNKLNGSFVASGTGDRELIFVVADEYYGGQLTMTNDIPDDFTTKYRTSLIKTARNGKFVISILNDYGITIAGTTLTPSNHTDVVFGTGTVTFDTNGLLILNGAVIGGEIVVAETAQLPETGLKIFLKGNSTITNTTGNAITYGGTTSGKLTFVTDGNTAGTLVYTNSSAPTIETAFNNFTVGYDNGLTLTIDNTQNTITIAESMPMTVDHVGDEKETDYSTMNSGESTDGKIINGLLYTTGETAGNFEATSGLAEIEGQTRFVFTAGSAMTQGAVDAITAEPCTQEYANAFIGATAKVPAGGVIVETSAWADDNHAVMLKAPGQDPLNITNPAKSVTPNHSGIYVHHRHHIYLPEAGTIRIYLSGFEGFAPRMSNHRIGPKSSVAGALGGVKVTSSMIQTSEPPATTYKVMEKSQVTSAIASIGDAMGGYTCNDPDITDLPDDMFVDKTSSPAPRRGAGVKTILPDGLTFVNFSGTKITGMEVSREKGAFNGVPENVFIYMPAGNSVAKGTKNVVIGGICDVMELNGGVDAKPFKANKNFKAGQVTLKRTFDAYDNEAKAATIYLPFAISQEDADKMGSFYKYESNDGSTVTMTKVDAGGLKANMPYIFKAKAGGVENPMVRSTDVTANPSVTDGFKGVYARKDYESGMYCYAAEGNVGQFVEMGAGSYVPPFRAYMIGSGAPSYAILWDGVIENMEEEPNMTAVETVKTTQNKKAAEGWWTLNGVRLNGQPQKPGMYIVNGRLVVVK